jgi:hypothetical protein
MITAGLADYAALLEAERASWPTDDGAARGEAMNEIDDDALTAAYLSGYEKGKKSLQDARSAAYHAGYDAGRAGVAWPTGDDAALALAKATGESWRLRFPHLTAWEDYSEEMRRTHVALQKDVLRRLAVQQQKEQV